MDCTSRGWRLAYFPYVRKYPPHPTKRPLLLHASFWIGTIPYHFTMCFAPKWSTGEAFEIRSMWTCSKLHHPNTETAELARHAVRIMPSGASHGGIVSSMPKIAHASQMNLNILRTPAHCNPLTIFDINKKGKELQVHIGNHTSSRSTCKCA